MLHVMVDCGSVFLCVGTLLMCSLRPADSLVDQEDGTARKQQQKAVTSLYFVQSEIISYVTLRCAGFM